MSASIALTSTLPRPPAAPPKGPLPALPVSKTRSTYSDNASLSVSRPGTSGTTTPATTPSKLPSRSVTTSALPTPQPKQSYSTPAVPTLSTTQSTSRLSAISPDSSGRASPASGLPTRKPLPLRKTASIGAFPLPPTAPQRVSSLPPSPLSTAENVDANRTSGSKTRRESTKSPGTEGTKRPRSSRSSGYGLRPRASVSNLSTYGRTPSLLNKAGEASAISGMIASRTSDSFLTTNSSTQSRSSSANGSYATDATQFEDIDPEPVERGRPKSQDATSLAPSSKRASGAKDSAKGNVLVSVRVRPDAGSGDSPANEGEWMVDGRRSLISYQGKEGGDYRYDNVFSAHDNNSRVYDNAAKRLVRRVMEGYHGTVFAYGMTGTGKTFSMQGTAVSPGVIPLAITDIFSYIRENPNREFLLRVSYLEIYNEKIYDLLSQSTPGQGQAQGQQEEIKLREDSKRGVYATPLKEEIVQSPNQLLRVIARGDLARRTSSTQFNARSSRSHAVVQIVVESRERTPSHGAYFDKETRRNDRILPGGVLVSTLSLIDLAGSERAADDKERRTEGAHINKSLLTLGTVIARLSGDDEKDKEDGKAVEKEKSGLKHLPYRDSKLTRLLQPALSGNSLVSILCTIQLSSIGTSAIKASSHVGETLNTLKFASRAKNNIVSHAKRNESNANGGDAGSRALLDRYRLEIQELRSQLDAQNKAKEVEEEKDEMVEDRKKEEELERQEQVRHEEQMLEMQLARTALKERISHLNRLILSSKSLGVNSGRFSSASTPLNRMSSMSQLEFGRPVSVRSRDSLGSQQAQSRRESAATLDVPASIDSSVNRTLSSGSTAHQSQPGAQTIAEDPSSLDAEDDYANLGDAEGNASLAQQNRMLQSDLADKNRYIATLEKRLLQARRTSHSRVSMNYMSRGVTPDENAAHAALREKDREIDELRAKLDDQMRMVTALRSAARKRDLLDKRKSHQSEETVRPATSNGIGSAEANMPPRVSSRTSLRSARLANGISGHRSNPSTASHSSSGPGSYSKPLSPVALLSPSISELSEGSKDSPTLGESKFTKMPRRKSVDEMTMLLDQMIQDKVESGQVVRGDRGSLRLKRDTVMEQRAAAAGEPSADLKAVDVAE